MRTALDANPSQHDEEERKFVSDVREHGWFDTHVFDGDPSFSYTTGFALQDSPDFIVFSLNRTVSHDIFWDLFRDACAGVRRPNGTRLDDVIANLPVFLFPVADRYHKKYLGWSRWFYGTPVVPTLQVVWPDRAGLFPWEADFDEEFRNGQPDLSEQGWSKELAA